jgi:hypothetical protein
MPVTGGGIGVSSKRISPDNFTQTSSILSGAPFPRPRPWTLPSNVI